MNKVPTTRGGLFNAFYAGETSRESLKTEFSQLIRDLADCPTKEKTEKLALWNSVFEFDGRFSTEFQWHGSASSFSEKDFESAEELLDFIESEEDFYSDSDNHDYLEENTEIYDWQLDERRQRVDIKEIRLKNPEVSKPTEPSKETTEEKSDYTKEQIQNILFFLDNDLTVYEGESVLNPIISSYLKNRIEELKKEVK